MPVLGGHCWGLTCLLGGGGWEQWDGGAAGCPRSPAEPPAPRGCRCGAADSPGAGGDTTWAAKPKGDEGRGCGSNGTEVGTSPPDGISPPNLCVSPPHPRHRERPEPRRETRTWLSPRPNLPPQPRSSLGGIRGDETSRKTHPHVLRGIYNNLLPGWTHGAAMSWAGGGGGSQIHRPQPCHRGRAVPPWNPLPRLQRGGTRSCWGDSTGSGSFPSSRATRSAQSSRRVLGGCSPAWRGGTAANRQLISAR